jgi:hypothetical protein
VKEGRIECSDPAKSCVLSFGDQPIIDSTAVPTRPESWQWAQPRRVCRWGPRDLEGSPRGASSNGVVKMPSPVARVQNRLPLSTSAASSA